MHMKLLRETLHNRQLLRRQLKSTRLVSVRALPDAYPDLDAFVNKIAALNRHTVAEFKVIQEQTVADFNVIQEETVTNFKINQNQAVDKAMYELKLECHRLQFIFMTVILTIVLGAGSDSLIDQFVTTILLHAERDLLSP